jgi:hypothetical protein
LLCLGDLLGARTNDYCPARRIHKASWKKFDRRPHAGEDAGEFFLRTCGGVEDPHENILWREYVIPALERGAVAWIDSK